jgi:hypothetical protein
MESVPRRQRFRNDKPRLFLGRGLFGDDAIILRRTLHAFANLFASWIVSHKPELCDFSRATARKDSK